MNFALFHAFSRLRILQQLLALLTLSAVCAHSTQAQLAWGTGGNGGSGTWNNTNQNWWDGSNNVTWNSGAATFGGTGGTVTVSGVTATAMTFNVAGYTVQSGTITAANNLAITANQDATISAFLTSNGISSTLTKTGSGALTVSGTNFFDNVQVNAGEYRVGGSSGLFFSTVNLANAPGAAITFTGTSTFPSVGSLSGGGTAGGIVQPDTQARTVTLQTDGSGTFGGTLQDNGSGKLGFQIFGTGATQVLTGTNTYSGPTTPSFGTISFAGNGSALNTAVTVPSSGILQLDNSGTALANRLSDTADVTIQGGQLLLIGNDTTPVEEQLGALKFAEGGTVGTSQSGSVSALMTFSGAARVNLGTVNVTGTGVTWSGIANGSNGIIGNYVTAGNEWAVAGTGGRIAPLAVYSTDINGASSGDHVKITGGGTTALPGSRTWSTLNLQNSSGSTGTLDLASQTLKLAGGGVLTSGTSANVIQNGTISSTGSELAVINRNALTIAASISENVAGTAFTKSGAGTLTLTGQNSYSGTTTIDQGILVVSSDANLGTGATISFNNGTLRASGSFSSAKGFNTGTSLVGTIDTGVNNVTFSGPNANGLSKTGTGTLTLTNGSTGFTNPSQGTLNLPNATSGSVFLGGATLQAAGTLSSISTLSGSAASALDVGGPGANTITTGTFSSSGQTPFTIRFGVGSASKDLINITAFAQFGFSPKTTLFDFLNLGGAATGTDYTLINFPAGNPVQVTGFGFAPNSTAAGWNGTFKLTSSSVVVNFSSVPEPGVDALLGIAFVVFGMRFIRRRTTKRP